MNFALSTIIIIALLLPGAIAIKGYYSSMRAKISNSFVPLNELLFQGILASFLIHSAAICLLKIFDWEVNFNFLYNLILGKDEKNFVFSNNEFDDNFLQFSAYILSCTFISCSLVKIFKYFVHRAKLDMKFNFLRNANHWFLINSVLNDLKKIEKVACISNTFELHNKTNFLYVKNSSICTNHFQIRQVFIQ